MNDSYHEPNVKRAFDLVMQLMAIPGKTGEEAEIQQFVHQRLIKAGADPKQIRIDSAHKRTPRRGQVGNMVLKLPGTVRAPRRMMSAHLDTVPICVGCRPLREGNLVRSAVPGTGLGADDRAGVAVILNSALEIIERGLPHPPLTFCWFVQEEMGLNGSRCASIGLWGKPKLAFNWDGGSPYKLTIGATGGYRMEIEVTGIASHAGGAPEWGVSAIAIASLAIADLYRTGWHGDIRLAGNRGTSNVGFIHGGEATNVVTDRVVLRAEARSHSPKFRQRILREIESAFKRASCEVLNVGGQSGSVTFNGHLDYESFKLPKSEPSVEVAADTVRSLGREPELAISNGGVDANWMTAHGIPTVTIGCGQLNQHMVTEALDIGAFEDACRIGLRLTTV